MQLGFLSSKYNFLIDQWRKFSWYMTNRWNTLSFHIILLIKIILLLLNYGIILQLYDIKAQKQNTCLADLVWLSYVVTKESYYLRKIQINWM